jgi:hypothetical protein
MIEGQGGGDGHRHGGKMTGFDDDISYPGDPTPADLGEDPTPEELKEFWAWVDDTAAAYYESMTIPF